MLGLLALTACGGGGGSPAAPDDPGDTGDSGGQEQYPDPGPGPHFSVTPVELDKLARVTPLGTDGKVLPIGHTYWYTCDTEWLLPVDRPCVREHLAIRAPVSGTIFSVEPAEDGGITVEGPPGLYAAFNHVTPTAGLERGDTVDAGDTIAVMHTDFAFDFGVTDYHLEPHSFINPERFRNVPAYLHSESPIAQYAEPLRSQLIDRVSTMSDPLGRITFDVAGTAAGGWFLEGTPYDDSFTPAYEENSVFLGPLQERDDVRIVSKVGWFLAVMDIAVVGPDSPRWEDITPDSGRVWVPLWAAARDGSPDLDKPLGGVLVQVLADEKLRIEWFDTQEEQTGFTAAAGMYER